MQLVHGTTWFIPRSLQTNPFPHTHTHEFAHIAAYYVYKSVERTHSRLNSPIPTIIGPEGDLPYADPHFLTPEFEIIYHESVFAYDATYNSPHQVLIEFQLIYNDVVICSGTCIVYDSVIAFRRAHQDPVYRSLTRSTIVITRYGNLFTNGNNAVNDILDQSTSDLLAICL